MDWARWTAWDNQIHTWIGSHEWIKEPAGRKYIEWTQGYIARKQWKGTESIMNQINGQRHYIGGTSAKVNAECLKSEGSLWTPDRSAYGTFTGYIWHTQRQRERWHRDDRRESTEIKESAFAITQSRFADSRNGAELIRNWSLRTMPIVDFLISVVSVSSLPLSLREPNVPGKCAVCTAIWCPLAAFTL